MRKGILKLILTVCAGAMSVQAFAQDTLHLTLDDALKIALSENRTLKIAEMEVVKKGYARKGTYASLFPQIDFSTNYQRTIKKQVLVMGDQSIAIGTDNTWSTGFSASMPLVNVPLWKSIQITGQDVELAVEKARGSKIDLIEQVKQSFFAVLLAKDSYEVYKENYNTAVDNYNVVKDKYDAGKTSQYDLLTAEVAVRNAEPNMYNAQGNIVVTQWQLKAVLGLDLNNEIACDGNLKDYEYELARVSEEDPMAAADTLSLDKNSTLKQLEIQDEQLHKTYQSQLAKYYPTLAGSISYNWNAMTNTFRFNQFNWTPYSVAGISLTIPIFSGGQRYYTLKQTKVQREQMALQIEETRKKLEVSITQSLSSLNTSAKQYTAAKKSIESAEKGNSIAHKRYEIGSGTLLEMQNSQLALMQSRLNLNSSIYNYLVTKSSLDKILGVSADNL